MKKSFLESFDFDSILVKNYDAKLCSLAHAKINFG